MADAVAYNTYQSYLMHSDDGKTWKKFIDVKTVPALFQTPPTLDATTLSDPAHVYIADIDDNGGSLEFTANDTPANQAVCEAAKGKVGYWAVWFGGTRTAGVETPVGDRGKWSFQGTLAWGPSERSTGSVSEITLALVPQTAPEYAAA